MAEQIQAALTILRRRQVEKKVGLSRSPIYARIKAGDFPRPVRLGNSRAVGWLEHEVDSWLAAQVEKSRKA
jgi:prophage regulatory protein